MTQVTNQCDVMNMSPAEVDQRSSNPIPILWGFRREEGFKNNKGKSLQTDFYDERFTCKINKLRSGSLRSRQVWWMDEAVKRGLARIFFCTNGNPQAND